MRHFLHTARSVCGKKLGADAPVIQLLTRSLSGSSNAR